MTLVVQTPQKLRVRRRIRSRILQSGRASIQLTRTNQYLNALIFNEGGQLRASVSTRSLSCKGSSKNKKAAALLSTVVAERCQVLGVSKLAFNRSANKYHGVVAAFADPLKKVGILI